MCIVSRGYRGRAGIFEALAMNKEIRKIILKSRDFIDEDALRTAAMNNGMKTLRPVGDQSLKSGVTSVENIEGIIIED